jgi:DNA-binding MarR family transcriptional regulator
MEAWRLVLELIQAVKHHFMAAAQEFELPPPALAALRSLDPERAMPMSELAASLHIDNSTVTGIVDRLEEHGLVERRTATHDRRVKLLAVTDAGAETRDRLLARMEEAPGPIASLSLADQEALRDILRRALA